MQRPLSFCNVQFEGSLSSSTTSFWQIVRDLGGEVSHCISESTTHLICPESISSSSWSVSEAVKNNVFVVTESWLMECDSTKSRVPESRHFVPGVQQPASTASEAAAIPSGPFEGVTGNVKLQSYSESATAPPFPSDYEIIRNATLQLTDIGANSNKYYALELHEAQMGGDKKYRIFVHYGRTGDLEANANAGTRLTRFPKNLDVAKAAFNTIYREKTGKGYNPVKLMSSNIGSAKARSLTASSEDVDDGSSTLDPRIAKLVREIYDAAEASLTSTVSAKITSRGIETPLGVLTREQVEEGEAILENIERALAGNNRDLLKTLSGQFYTLIPHRIGRSQSAVSESVIDSFAKHEKKQQLVQLMKDLLGVIEAQQGLSGLTKTDMRYNALNCSISPVDDHFEVADIERFIASKNESANIKVMSIFKISRAVEERQFKSSIGGVQQLIHGSRFSNYVGLLSRGLLMPKVVVDMGVKRTDAGNLGNGIYFGDSVDTAAKYAHPGQGNTRLMLINDVALGRAKQYRERQIGMTAPPSGYDSVHGVRASVFSQSFFEDDEYVVFDAAQQKLKYLVEFYIDGVDSPDLSFPLSISSTATESFPVSISSTATKPAVTATEPVSRDIFDDGAMVPQSQSSFQTPRFGSSFGSTVSSGSGNQNLIEFTPEQRTMKESEDEFRELFANDRDSYRTNDAVRHMVNIYNNRETFRNRQLTAEEAGIPKLLDQFVGKFANDYSVTSETEFRNNWDVFTNGALNGLNWNNVFAAGGAVLAMLSPEGVDPNNSSDIDLFLYGLSESAATAKAKEIFALVSRNTGNSGNVIRSANAITIIGSFPYRHIQIILRLYKNPAEVLMGFDIDCCAVGYDGTSVFALPRAQRAINAKYNLVDLSRRSLTYEVRLNKYAKRGYAVLIPGFGPNILKTSASLFTYMPNQVKGLAKLLVFDQELKSGQRVVALEHPDRPKSSLMRSVVRLGDDDDKVIEYQERQVESDYDNVVIPWGRQWSGDAIMKMLQRDQQSQSYAARHQGRQDTPTFSHGVAAVFDESGTRSLGGMSASSGISWTKTNPGAQLMTGSFHPVSDNQWTNMADYTRAQQVYKKPLASAPIVPAPAATFSKSKGSSVYSMSSAPSKSIFSMSSGSTKPKATKNATKKASSVKRATAKASKKVSTVKRATAKKTVSRKPPSNSDMMYKKAKSPKAVKKGVKRKAVAMKGAPMKSFPMAQPTAPFTLPTAPSQMYSAEQQVPASGYGQGSDELALAISRGAAQLEHFGAPKQPLSGRSLEAESLSGAFTTTIPPQSYVSKLLLLLSRMFREGSITSEEKSKLKDMVLEKQPIVLSALEVFEVDHDFEELADTFRRICQL